MSSWWSLSASAEADHLALVVARDARALHPAPPIVERALGGTARRSSRPPRGGFAPGEDEMAVGVEQERALVLDVA